MDRKALVVWRQPFVRVAAAALIVLLGVVGAAQLASSSAQAKDDGSCRLGPDGQIRHVISIQFDNVHFTRDNPNVPSDLEQMPNLLNFIESNGVLDDNNHTPLIAHTANDLITSFTGLYPDQQGIPVSNSYGEFTGTNDSSVSFQSAFTYWTSQTADGSLNLITPSGTNTPAPWVPFTRAGCNVGGYSTADMVLENLKDIPQFFGPNSPEANEATTNPTQAAIDFEGVSVHCAKGSDLCSSAHDGVSDPLPGEPGGYVGYNGLFGDKVVAPQISSTGVVLDLNGNPIHGVNGFNPSASQSLGYVAAMQEHGVPVTYAYISDAHDNHANGGTFGPGEAGYVAQLKAYDQAFGAFFARLAKDGINQSNTLFIFSADENDHFVGGAPSPTNCDGVTVPCTYSQIGEEDGNLSGLLQDEFNNTTPFKVHSDSAPNFYIIGNPSQTSSTTRTLERDVGGLTVPNLLTGQTIPLTNALADQTEMNLLHMMVTADPARNPNFTLFANPDYFLFASGSCSPVASCVTLEGPTGFAWNHGDVSPDINTTWLGMVGPGVRHLGVTNQVWSDHTDIRPTMMALLHLKDDYAHDGRVLFEFMNSDALPDSLRDDADVLSLLAQVYKEINAPVNDLGLDSLKISTVALESNAANDSTYSNLESQLATFTTQRNHLASQMISMLEGAAFKGHGINEHQALQLIFQSEQLLNQVFSLAQSL
ncbi:MAG TPA: hypothetical protein VKT82_20025 [Ktedonobacterales bacterium]|nr:hypothetical protein [Ktedonobacterales bacterium]